MVGPSPSWSTAPIRARYRSIDGAPYSGTVEFKMNPRIVGITDDYIFPAGKTFTATLGSGGQITSVEGGVTVDHISLPVTDDPDNSPSGWVYEVTERIEGVPDFSYKIQPLMAHVGGGINLKDIVAPGTPAATGIATIRGVAGGVAALNADGDVVDASGEVVGSGGGGGGGVTEQFVSDAIEAAIDTEREARIASGRYQYFFGINNYSATICLPPSCNHKVVVAIGYHGVDPENTFVFGRVSRVLSTGSPFESDFLAYYGDYSNASGDFGEHGEISTIGVESDIGEDATFVHVRSGGYTGGLLYVVVDMQPENVQP